MCVASLLFFQLFPCLSGCWLLGLGAASSDAVETPLVCSLDGPTAGPFCRAESRFIYFPLLLLFIIIFMSQMLKLEIMPWLKGINNLKSTLL